jgi:hypothetical protein
MRVLSRQVKGKVNGFQKLIEAGTSCSSIKSLNRISVMERMWASHCLVTIAII